LVTGVPAAEPYVDPDTLTDEDIVTFVQTVLQANISADGWNLTDGSFLGINTAGTTVYSGGYTNNIMQYAVEEVPSLTFTYAFNTLTPSVAADISQITNVAEWRFQSYVIAVDTAARYGLRVTNFNSVYYIIRSDLNFMNSIHWHYDVNTQSVTLESGLSITSNTDPIFVDMIVYSSTRGVDLNARWNGGFHLSGYGAGRDTLNTQAYMILKSSEDDPIVSFSFRPGAGTFNGAIKSYTIFKHLGAPLADWDAWVTKGRIISKPEPNPEPDLPSDGNWEVVKVRTNISQGTWVSYP
jgi:hypothetical protein